MSFVIHQEPLSLFHVTSGSQAQILYINTVIVTIVTINLMGGVTATKVDYFSMTSCPVMFYSSHNCTPIIVLLYVTVAEHIPSQVSLMLAFKPG